MTTRCGSRRGCTTCCSPRSDASPATPTRWRCRSGAIRTVDASSSPPSPEPRRIRRGSSTSPIAAPTRRCSCACRAARTGRSRRSSPATSTTGSGSCSTRTGPGPTTTRPRPSAESRWCACPRPTRPERAPMSDLPAGVVEWVAEVGGGEVTRLERHVARREAWVVDVTRPDGSVLEGFLRLEREPIGLDSPTSLLKETKVVEALAGSGVPVPEVYGRNDELSCTLFERVRGRSDIDRLTAPRQQRAVMEDFIRVMARMHTLDVDALGLTPYLAWVPADARAGRHGPGELPVRGRRGDRGHRLGVGPLRRPAGGSRQLLRARVLEPVRRTRRSVPPVRAGVGHPLHPVRGAVLPGPAERAGHDPDPRGHGARPPHRAD